MWSTVSLSFICREPFKQMAITFAGNVQKTSLLKTANHVLNLLHKIPEADNVTHKATVKSIM